MTHPLAFQQTRRTEVQEKGTSLPLVLTLDEAASQLRCSRAYLNRVLAGQVPDLPPLPVFHIGRKVCIRTAMLQRWIARLEAREREAYYASGFGGLRDDELEFIAGA
jgi:hypothetical protein